MSPAGLGPNVARSGRIHANGSWRNVPLTAPRASRQVKTACMWSFPWSYFGYKFPGMCLPYLSIVHPRIFPTRWVTYHLKNDTWYSDDHFCLSWLGVLSWTNPNCWLLKWMPHSEVERLGCLQAWHRLARAPGMGLQTVRLSFSPSWNLLEDFEMHRQLEQNWGIQCGVVGEKVGRFFSTRWEITHALASRATNILNQFIHDFWL